MQRRRQIEIPQHVGGRGAAGGIVAMVIEVTDQALQQVQRTVDALVAGLKHLEGLLEAHRRRLETGQSCWISQEDASQKAAIVRRLVNCLLWYGLNAHGHHQF